MTVRIFPTDPGPDELRSARLWLGLSGRELGAALRLGRNGTELVHRWEEAGSGIKPTPLARAALHYLVVAANGYPLLTHSHHPEADIVGHMLPESVMKRFADQVGFDHA